jgi:hypothetical protein
MSCVTEAECGNIELRFSLFRASALRVPFEGFGIWGVLSSTPVMRPIYPLVKACYPGSTFYVLLDFVPDTRLMDLGAG